MQAMTRLVLIAILLVGLAVPAWAGSDEGVAAYERSDYETAFREFLSLAEQGDAPSAPAISKEMKIYDLTCTDVGFVANPEGFKKSFRPHLGLEIREGTTFNAEIYLDFNEQGKAFGGRMNLYHGYDRSSEPVNYDFYFVSGSGFRITFVTHDVARGITTYSFMPKFGLLTRFFMTFQVNDNADEGKLPGNENVVVEQYFCTRNVSQN